MDNIISVPQAAEILGITQRAVIKAIKAGKIQARKLGREWMLDETSVRAYKPKTKRAD